MHDIDVMNWVVGERPVSVFAVGHAEDPMYRDCGDVDTCLIVLKYPGLSPSLLQHPHALCEPEQLLSGSVRELLVRLCAIVVQLTV